MNRQNVLVFFVVTLSFAFAAGSVIAFGDTQDDDMDIYIRDHVNSSCTLWVWAFDSDYDVNDTTECGCLQPGVTRCTTTIIHNQTDPETTPGTTAATTAAPKAGLENLNEEIHLEHIQSAVLNDDGDDDDDSDESEEY